MVLLFVQFKPFLQCKLCEKVMVTMISSDLVISWHSNPGKNVSWCPITYCCCPSSDILQMLSFKTVFHSLYFCIAWLFACVTLHLSGDPAFSINLLTLCFSFNFTFFIFLCYMQIFLKLSRNIVWSHFVSKAIFALKEADFNRQQRMLKDLCWHVKTGGKNIFFFFFLVCLYV